MLVAMAIRVPETCPIGLIKTGKALFLAWSSWDLYNISGMILAATILSTSNAPIWMPKKCVKTLIAAPAMTTHKALDRLRKIAYATK